ncbi:HAD family hydrolase [Alkalihalobacillus sp. BA299]|uniref:HAD family hydrolase n=1 Tax=Alkalihalobacillus sp. BA299 TaxID=2815938 RepID=UPI001ADA321B|nr:HAD hydrolase-like protein [Alkalihalobacillus sp. BA299]
MKEGIKDFEKTKPYLVCVDSDGCAMDTMDVKHQKCFGPKAIEVWGLQDIEERFMEIWNEVNLYSISRGINRFKGLVRTFDLVAEEGYEISDLSTVKEWTETTDELSNPSLEREIAKTDDQQLKKTLDWSLKVNQAITELSDDDEPFSGVKEGLAKINDGADIAIVSSANGGAVRDEWTRHELISHVQAMLGQESGTKAHCIAELQKFGYEPTKILMVGDAPGDLEAAKVNCVLYYPILVGNERFSWERLASEALTKFYEGSFAGEYQQQLINEFHSNLQK